jgi:cruciform cutting endonuclease 1
MGHANILEWTVRVNMLEAMLYAILHTLRSSQSWDGSVIPINPGMVGSYWLDGSEGRGTVGGRVKGMEARKKSVSIRLETEAETGADDKGKTGAKSGIGRGSKTKNAKAITKGLKIDLVGAILSSSSTSSALSSSPFTSPSTTPSPPPLLPSTPEAHNTATAYLSRWQTLRKYEAASPLIQLKTAKAKAKSLTKSKKGAKKEAEAPILAPKQKVGTATEELSKLDDLADCLLQGLAWVEWERNREVLRREGVTGLGVRFAG